MGRVTTVASPKIAFIKSICHAPAHGFPCRANFLNMLRAQMWITQVFTVVPRFPKHYSRFWLFY